jgi:hypothetical protein
MTTAQARLLLELISARRRGGPAGAGGRDADALRAGVNLATARPSA